MPAIRPLFTLALVAAATALCSGPAAARTPGHADLAVTRVSGVPHGTLAAGASLPVSATVRNRGRRAGHASKLALFLSADRRHDDRDLSAGGASVPRLRGARRLRLRTRLPIPAGAAGRRWSVLVCAHATRRVREPNERNNCRASKRASVVALSAAGGPGGPPAGG